MSLRGIAVTSEILNGTGCEKCEYLTVIQSNIPKWIAHLSGYHFFGTFRHNVKYKTWISGYSARVDTHDQVSMLSTEVGLTVSPTSVIEKCSTPVSFGWWNASDLPPDEINWNY